MKRYKFCVYEKNNLELIYKLNMEVLFIMAATAGK